MNQMAQSTMMMFSPDGDNEVDMPGSASVFIGHDRSHVGGSSKRSSQGLSNKRGGNQGPQESIPHGGVFHLDDDEDFFSGSDDMNGDSGHHNGLTNGRFDGALGEGRTDLSNFLEQEEDDDDEGSLM